MNEAMSEKWILTVGLEVHVELETKTKMFCGCRNDPFGSPANTNICPICLGLPGALPLLNKEAIKMTLKLGQALKGEIDDQSFWARKNYFYPDLPKGYQISQSSSPLVKNATLVIDGENHRIERIHLEEDAGKLIHQQKGSSIGITPLTITYAEDKTYADFNRAGVPLIEIVTEPDFHSAAAAKRFCQELQTLLRHLKLSQADMEKGRMRCEANISISNDPEKLGTKVEVKNINSFRAVEKAIEYEFNRQTKALEDGESITQETRTWNETENKTVVMRSKETASDYRYFPEPDLPAVKITLKPLEGDGLLPDQQRQEMVSWGIPVQTSAIMVSKGWHPTIKGIREIAADQTPEAANLLTSIPQLAELSSPEEQLHLMYLQKKNGWTKNVTIKVVNEALATKKSVEEVAENFSLTTDLGPLISKVIEDNKSPVADFKAGKTQALNFLVGRVMAETQGKANIDQVRTQLQEILKTKA